MIDKIETPTAADYVDSLFRRYRAPLQRYLTGLLPNSEDAAELVQETYLRLLRQEGLDHIEANARAYVFQIATNLVRDYFRQRKAHHVEQHAAIEGYRLEPQLQESAEAIGWDDTLARFKQALLALDPLVREAFLLHRFRDMTYPEIARALNLGTRTVERYMSEAVAHLKRAMEWDL